MSKSQSNRKLNCLGLYCSELRIKTRIEPDKIKTGEILEVIADEPAAKEDVKSLVERLNYQLLDFRKEGMKLYFLIKKS
ncbi:sulfurtransferase TusA family protein [Candidatus Bathyarchaeota archaeon]|nr:sulfurtransferase TusA family protein [Candidatus Bathyarchaeota archaeon]